MNNKMLDSGFMYNEVVQGLKFAYLKAGGIIPPTDGAQGYYVYIAVEAETYDSTGPVVYIGSGTGSRFDHVRSGTSHNYKLNELHFQGAELDVLQFQGGLSKDMAMYLETKLIDYFRPWANVYGNVSAKTGEASPYRVGGVITGNPLPRIDCEEDYQCA